MGYFFVGQPHWSGWCLWDAGEGGWYLRRYSRCGKGSPETGRTPQRLWSSPQTSPRTCCHVARNRQTALSAKTDPRRWGQRSEVNKLNTEVRAILATKTYSYSTGSQAGLGPPVSDRGYTGLAGAAARTPCWCWCRQHPTNVPGTVLSTFHVITGFIFTVA